MAGAAAGVDQVGAAANEIAQALLLGGRGQAEGKRAGAMQPQQLLGVAAVGLHPAARLARGERGGDDVAGDPDRGEQPIGRVAAGAGLVADHQALGLAEALDQPAQVALGVGDLDQLEPSLAGIVGLEGGDDRARARLTRDLRSGGRPVHAD